MIRAPVVLLVTLSAVVLAGAVPEIFLPKDAEVVTIVGNGFTLQVNQLNTIKNQWSEVAEESAKVDVPRKVDEEKGAVVNTNIIESIEKDGGEKKSYGVMTNGLRDWISKRADQLNARIERLYEELEYLRSKNDFKIQGQIIATQVLLLNTMVDLSNLRSQRIKGLEWIRLKIRDWKKERQESTKSIATYVELKINASKKLESELKGTNKPTKEWFTITKALKRVLHEQRFSPEIGQTIVDYLGSHFSMMPRARIYDIHRIGDKLDDGLFYPGVKGIIPVEFPFSSQEAIVNGA